VELYCHSAIRLRGAVRKRLCSSGMACVFYMGNVGFESRAILTEAVRVFDCPTRHMLGQYAL
jgi:hypothetical protein